MELVAQDGAARRAIAFTGIRRPGKYSSLSRKTLFLIDSVVVLSVITGIGFLLGGVERHAEASVNAAKVEAHRGADLSPTEYQSLMAHPLGGCEQFIQKCGDGRCRVYPVCADATKRKK